MPCYTPPHAYCKHEDSERERALCDVLSKVTELDRQNKRILENQHDQLMYYKNNSDKVTDMLCRLMGMLENNQDWPTRFDEGSIDVDILDWWKCHKEWDKQRSEK